MNFSTHRILIIFAVSGISALATVNARAAVNVYTNRPAWEAAVGPLSGTETFNSFLADTSFKNVVVPLNNMTVTGTVGFNGDVTQKIDVPALEFSGFYNMNGTAQLLGDLGTTNHFIRINFLTPVVSWGADTKGLADTPRSTRISIFSATNDLLGFIQANSPADNMTQAFYGFDLTTGAASYLIFADLSNNVDVFGIDNIGFVKVPEPTGLVLLASTTLSAIGLLCRRGARKTCAAA